MIKSLLISSVLLGFNYVMAQDDERHSKNGIAIFAYANDPGLNITANYYIYKGQHAGYIGLKIPLPFLQVAYKEMVGINFGYLIFPNKRPQKFDLFFQYDFQVSQAEGRYYNGGDWWVKDGENIAFYNTLGYGFNIKAFKTFYLQHSLGLGIRTGWTIGSASYTGLGIIAKLGLGYNFKNRKKRIKNCR